MKRLLLLMAIAALAAALGVGYASSGSREEPLSPPDPTVEDVYVADRFGNALRCAGKLVRVDRGDLGGGIPTLTPAQAVERMNGRATLGALSFTGFACAKDELGRETGAVAARVVDGSGHVSTRTISGDG